MLLQNIVLYVLSSDPVSENLVKILLKKVEGALLTFFLLLWFKLVFLTVLSVYVAFKTPNHFVLSI